jgi:hypothetical protein
MTTKIKVSDLLLLNPENNIALVLAVLSSTKNAYSSRFYVNVLFEGDEICTNIWAEPYEVISK